MSTKIWFSLVAVVTMSFALVGVAEDKKAGPVNAKCPFSGKEINAEATLDIKVGFCCNNCKGKFDKDPIACMTAKPVKALDKCPLSGKDAGDASSTVTVGFCCNNCKGKGEKDQVAILGKIAPAKSK